MMWSNLRGNVPAIAGAPPASVPPQILPSYLPNQELNNVHHLRAPGADASVWTENQSWRQEQDNEEEQSELSQLLNSMKQSSKATSGNKSFTCLPGPSKRYRYNKQLSKSANGQ